MTNIEKIKIMKGMSDENFRAWKLTEKYRYEVLRKRRVAVLAWVRMDEEENVLFSDKETWK